MIKKEKHLVSYSWLLPLPTLLVLYAIFRMPNLSLLSHLVQLFNTHSPGVHDYFATVGFAPTILNAGLMGFAVLGLLKFNKLPMNANSISALFLMMGFAFIGKNLINFIPFLFGGYLYAKLQKIPFKRVLVAALLTSCLAPLVDFALLITPFDFFGRYLVSILVGVLLGLVAIPISSHLLLTHQGYNLYNMGFAAGFIGIIAVSTLQSIGLDTALISIVSSEGDSGLVAILGISFIYFIVKGVFSRTADDKPYRELFTYSGRLVSDFTRLVGPSTTLVNMGVMGLIGLSFMLLFKVPASGPVLAGIFTLAGFASFGNHPKNTLPIMVGAMGGVLLFNNDMSMTSAVVATLFATTLAPIAGEYGVFAGLFVGVIHTSMVSSMAALHGGMNLYNNGFSGGLIATLVVPVIDAFKKEK
ncbi:MULTISPECIES: DUF1576 domain-containing protein [unclassified Fusibacter]|uniref:DUF1576 domain-containing protein n=1 Tax=unclassified Fusibacter TaxID=2624464 RepID=UPI00101149C1|nr:MULTISPECIES: DUF1576 domain-containing protein [unclassified Fusibacter]MCK8061658.1 DUF1576 domain-containing protein [Fusibacter sp. A2]NPE23842.1 DUF1576 domain-containing protein [Fusibacter sp. A1]RXV58615.1 DUF1576 domain-containing protein [Fusibacter sp. A1]